MGCAKEGQKACFSSKFCKVLIILSSGICVLKTF